MLLDESKFYTSFLRNNYVLNPSKSTDCVDNKWERF